MIGDSSTITSSLISAIANKANTSDTFLKTIVSNDVYLPILNKQFVSSSTTNNKLILQTQDSVGGTIGDNWYDALTLEMDINTPKNKCTILDALIVSNINVLTEIGTKANTSALSSYVLTSALTSSLSSYVLTSSLSSYVLSSALTTTLSSYVLTSALTTAMSSYVSTSALTTALSPYALKNNSTFTGTITIPNL